ncbi:MAG: LysM peptidoglycan-binding domain-containing protein [Anaerolineales bacterium]|nr:LysM peptidoglycan-binding domain-containing protein [Anaerolineales bacterium]
MKRFRILFTLVGAWLCLWPLTSMAQTGTPATPTPIPTTAAAEPTAVAPEPPPTSTTPIEVEIPKVHVVQEGEVLVSIAEQYETTADAIQILNNLSNPDALYVGQELLIPGVEGEAVPLFYVVEVGDTLERIAAIYNTTIDDIAALNNLITPAGLYAGARLSLISRTGSAEPQPVTGQPHIVKKGDTLLSVAAAYNMAPADLATANNLHYPVRLYAGQQLLVPSPAATAYHYLPDGWLTVTLNPFPFLKGNSAAVYVEHAQAGTPNGQLIGPDAVAHPLTFAPYENGYVALVGLDSFAPSGRYTLTLSGEGLQRPWLPFTQELIIADVDYGLQQITLSEEFAPLLVPEVRAEEDAYLDQLFAQFTPVKQWEGVFQTPVSNTIVTAGYGDARSYNGGPADQIFHTGIDYGGSVGTPILAPAAGTVIFTGTLAIRGQVLIIDHGLGVMTAYYHLSRYTVDVGDQVTAGQQVADGGSTGLSTGPHLHWDLRVMGAAVNPVQWLERPFP